jgi:hypothetical protein
MSNEHSQRIKTALLMLLAVALVGILDTPLITWAFLGAIYFAAFGEAMRLFRVADGSLWIFAGAIWLLAPFTPHPTDLVFGATMIQGGILA